MSKALRHSGINPGDVEQFKADGFLLVEDFFSDEELDRYGAAVDAAVSHRTSDDSRGFDEKNQYEQTFVQCMALWEDHVDVRPMTFHPKLCAASAALLETDCVRLWHDQALYKEAGGRKTDAHLDYPFWPIDRPDLVSAWVPFDSVRTGGGVMAYVRGSHFMEDVGFADIGHLRDDNPNDLLDRPDIADKELVWVEAPRGSVIFHHALTVHTAEANETNKTRRVFTMVYMADGCRRHGDAGSYFMDRENIAVGDKISGLGFPVAWPREEGDLPAAPELPFPKTGFGLDEQN